MNFQVRFAFDSEGSIGNGDRHHLAVLGVGANTAFFSLIDQLLLRPLPVERPQQLVQLATRGPLFGSSWGEDRLSYPMYRDIRDSNIVFSGALAYFAAP